MCWFSDLFKKKKESIKPEWVTQSSEQVAGEELDAAGIHYSICVALEEGQIFPENWGSYEHNWHWYVKHCEAAWYTDPEYTEERLGIS